MLSSLQLAPKIYDGGPSSKSDQYLYLHRNENLFINPEWKTRLVQRAAHSFDVSLYPDMYASSLRTALSKYLGVHEDQIYLGNGADGVLADLFCLFRQRFDTIVTQECCYRVYPLLAKRFSYQTEIWDPPFFSTSRLYVMDSPNSITGESISMAELDAMRSSNQSFLIWDNVYGEFEKQRSLRADTSSNMAIVGSFSKYFGLASARIGYCITHPDLVLELNQRKDVFHVNGFAQALALQMLEERSHLNHCLEEFFHCKQLLSETLNNLGFNITKSNGSFCAIRLSSRSAESLQADLKRNCIVVRRFYQSENESILRMTVPPMRKLETFLNVLKELARSNI